MRATPINALLVLLYGLAAGLYLWASGLDIALQHWLYANYNQTFNEKMRWLSGLSLGRTQLWGLIVVGLVAALYQGGLWGAWQALGVAGRQTLHWLKGQRGWLVGWQGQPLLTKLCLMALTVLAASGLLQILLKILIGRPRPKEMLWNGADPYLAQPLGFDSSFWSLPSGHTTSTCAIFVWLALGLPRWRIPLLLSATVLSCSRFLAVTPHYLGDVVAGAAVGAAVAMLMWSRTTDAR
jgi:membrane-associated phospholipid phosphatase